MPCFGEMPRMRIKPLVIKLTNSTKGESSFIKIVSNTLLA
ncbi:Uncharacterised protein [Vibrio cholerae]|nr:Uncharacterised protein [Vibrio cholerae]CSI31563.1 Uncharacterised protein [Vibrio cholerae]